MQSRVDPALIESQLQDFLSTHAEREGIAAAYLFGSVARGTEGPHRYVGLGLLYSEDPPVTSEILSLGLQDMEKLLGLPFRVVLLNLAASELIVRIFREGKLIFERDRSIRAQFEMRSRNEFWDFEPCLQLYRSKNGLPDPSLEDLVERNP